MWQSLVLSDGLDGDIQILFMLGAMFLPSIVALLLAFCALWLPDDGYVLPQQYGDRHDEHRRVNDRGRDWRRAA